jgi:hypothetical protein
MFSHLLRAGFCSLALLLCVSGTNPVAASEPCVTYKKVTTYEQRTTYVTKTEAYTKAVTLYDSYGCPYTVNKTFYRQVQVPVVETVAVIKYVPVTSSSY